jgi:hypothetical protein
MRKALDGLFLDLPQCVLGLIILLYPHNTMLQKQLAQALLDPLHRLDASQGSADIGLDLRLLCVGEVERVRGTSISANVWKPSPCFLQLYDLARYVASPSMRRLRARSSSSKLEAS